MTHALYSNSSEARSRLKFNLLFNLDICLAFVAVFMRAVRTNHSFELDLLMNPLIQVHKSSLNDLFMIQFQV